MPANITLLPLPSKCPELNSVENIWQFMRDNWLSNRIFSSYGDILDHFCFAWNRLRDLGRQPSTPIEDAIAVNEVQMPRHEIATPGMAIPGRRAVTEFMSQRCVTGTARLLSGDEDFL